MLPKHQGIIYAALSGLFFGLIGYFGMQAIHKDLSIYNMLFWRFAVCGLFIMLILRFDFKTILASPKDRLKMVFYGLVFYGFSSILYFIASHYIGTGLSMVIFFTYPAIVMLLDSLLFKNKITGIYVGSIAVILLGLICLVDFTTWHYHFIGIGLSLISALLYALYVIGSKKTGGSPLVSTLMLALGCMITCFLFALYDHSFHLPRGINVWKDILGIGIICTALPIICLFKGLKHISSIQASILSVLEPVVVVIVGVLLLHEKIIIQQVIGIVIVLIGALLSLISKAEG